MQNRGQRNARRHEKRSFSKKARQGFKREVSNLMFDAYWELYQMNWEGPGDVGQFEPDSYDEDYQFMLIAEMEREDKFRDLEHFDPALDEPKANQDDLFFVEFAARDYILAEAELY